MQVKLPVPWLVPVELTAVALPPGTLLPVVPEQVVPLTVQLTDCAVQVVGAGGVQLLPAGT